MGFILFFAFFGKLVLIATPRRESGCDRPETAAGRDRRRFASLRHKILALTLRNHAINATLWLFVSLIVVIARDIQAETRFYLAGGHAAPIRPRFAARALT